MSRRKALAWVLTTLAILIVVSITTDELVNSFHQKVNSFWVWTTSVPPSILLFGLALAGIGWLARRRGKPLPRPAKRGTGLV
jgi:hypothetical protein